MNIKKFYKVSTNIVSLLLSALMTGTVFAAPFPPMAGRTNLALGHKVVFSPAPNYRLTNKGNTNATDLTNGQTTKRKDQRIWWDAKAVGYSYPSKINMAVDLGKMCKINEVAIRFQGGTPNNGANIPGWVVVFVSNDGVHYHKVAEFSRFKKGEFKKFHIPPIKGKAWVDCLRFKNLHTQGRYVGLQIYGSALTVADELYVFGKGLGTRDKGLAEKTKPVSGFTVTHAEPYFHKPYLVLATNLALPLPIGMIAPDTKQAKQPVTFTLNVPAGIKLVAGKVGGVSVSDAKTRALPDGGTAYQFTDKKPRWTRTFGRLYVKAAGWSNGQKGKLGYSFTQGNWHSGQLLIPLRAVMVKPAPRLKNIMAGLGWWSARGSTHWPHVLHTWRVLGLNTFPIFTWYIRNQPKSAAPWKLLRKARSEGFLISAIDNGPFHRFLKDPEVYCHTADGKATKVINPSYRGKYYQKRMAIETKTIARIKPDFVSEDIEQFSAYAHMKTYKQDPLCQASFKASGLSSWKKWLQLQGSEMFKDIVKAQYQGLRSSGIHTKLDIGGYNFRAGKIYHGTFNFDALYPKWIAHCEPSYYTELYPYQIKMIGNEVRREHALLQKSDIMPWLTPGDAGTFPGRSLKWALLECYANGARGVWFWGRGLWDAEDLIAYNQVIRAIAPVEKIIVHGQLVGQRAQVIGPGRVSGMMLNGKMVLLVADYLGQTDGKVQLYLHLPKKSVVRNLLAGGKKITTLKSGQQHLTVNLNGKQAKLISIKPAR